MIGLDTTAIIDIFKGEDNIKTFLENNKEPLAVNIISYLELFFGLNPENPQHVIEGKYYDKFFKRLYNFNLNSESCKEASKIFWGLKKKGMLIEQFDCVIAAIFIANGITNIVTRNPKHFERVKQLSVISY
jgi:predicted nucleic acid-binding protein